MKNRLIALGFLIALGASTSLPALAQSSMSNSMSGPTTESAMSKLHDDMAAMKSTGNPDKDYLMNLKMLRSAMHTLMMSEMAHGKDAEIKAATKKAMASQAQFDPTFGHFDQKFISQ